MATKKTTTTKVEAAALPRDVFDCIAADIPRKDWEASLNACRSVAGLMPSVGQIQHLACAMLHASLVNAYEWATKGSAFKEEWVDAINAAELAADGVAELMAKLPMGGMEFCDEFFKLRSVARLAAAAFPDKGSAVWRSLDAAENGFLEIFQALELAGAFKMEGGAA